MKIAIGMHHLRIVQAVKIGKLWERGRFVVGKRKNIPFNANDLPPQSMFIDRQIGGFTVACGFWKWLEFLSHRITRNKVELVADFFSGRHNNFPRQFDKAWKQTTWLPEASIP